MQKKDILNKLSDIKPELKNKYNVVKIGLFGSFSREDFSEESDIDILVEYSENISLFKVVELLEYLENIFHKKIDLVNKKNIKDLIKKRILSEAIFV